MSGRVNDTASKEVRTSARGAACAVAAEGVIASLVACQHSITASERTCSGARAISAADLRGSSLPLKTVAFTFDDGPGPRTAELSSYLKSEGIRAGFFVDGKMITSNTGVLAQLVADGHVIGNHTQTHTSLTGRSTDGAHLADNDTVAELAQTDALIASFVPANRFMFRAPFGDFDDVSATAIKASAMKKYIGPISWDIGDHMGPNRAVDWDCWQPGSDGLVMTVPQCGDLYLKEIDSVGNGVVLLHDAYFIGGDPAKGGTVDMVKHLIPALEAKGYEFARIDEVPDIAALLPAQSSADASSSGSSGAAAPGTKTESSPTDPDEKNGGASGGKPDPCPPSPQQNSAK
jgi:peptidoglycan/xylan/chitin deacetylase (PgdA/CDA1 family)